MKTITHILFSSLFFVSIKRSLKRTTFFSFFAFLCVFGSFGILHASESNNISDVSITSVSDISVPSTSLGGASVTFTIPTAIEYDSVSVTSTVAPVSCSPNSGYLFPIGITQVTCIGQGQINPVSGTTTFQVTVQPYSSPDTTPSVITITGSSTVSLSVGSIYSDQGATAIDNVDGSLTSAIVSSSTVLASIPGSYTVIYTVTDTAGNTATSSRSVVVVDVAKGSYFTFSPNEKPSPSVFSIINSFVPEVMNLSAARLGQNNSTEKVSHHLPVLKKAKKLLKAKTLIKVQIPEFKQIVSIDKKYEPQASLKQKFVHFLKRVVPSFLSL